MHQSNSVRTGHSEPSLNERGYVPYPAYKDSGIEWLGRVPAHWETKKAAYIFSIGSGGTPSTDHAEYYNGNIAWVTTSDLRESVVTSTKKSISEKALRVFPSIKVYPEGSVIIAMYAGANIGRLGTLGIPAAVNQACCVFTDPKGIDARFWFYWLHARRSYLTSLGCGGAQSNLSQDLLKSISIPAPSLPEQYVIARFLDRETAKIDTLIEKQERLIDLLQERRIALISHAVSKGLDSNVPMKDSGIEWLGEIPAHWEVKRLKSLAGVKVSNVDKKTIVGQTTVKLCNYVDVYYNETIHSDLRFMEATATQDQIRRFSLCAGDVLITKDSEDWTDIAVPSVVAEDLPSVLCGYHLAQIRPNYDCEGSFLSRAFESLSLRGQYHVAANGITRFGLTNNVIRDSIFAMPPLSEQQDIATFLDRETAGIDGLVAKIHQAIKLQKELRSALISAAVTGKIDVRQTSVSTGKAPSRPA